MNQQPVIFNRKTSSVGKRNEEVSRRPGRMVVCLGNLPHVAVIERYFQERGWKVQLAGSADEARLLIRQSDATVALLAEDAPDESGWITCWKVLSDQPATQVCVIGTKPADEGSRFADFVGAAAYISAAEPASGIAQILKELQDAA